MDLIYEGFKEALNLLLSFDSEIFNILFLSLIVSGTATIVSVFIGVLSGTLIALNNFKGRSLIIALVNTGMGLPPVVVGLFVTIFLWRSGPLGDYRLLYTPLAMIIAQIFIATPIVMGFSIASIQNMPSKLPLQILTLGASRIQFYIIIIKETRLAIYAAVMAGFGGVISEVGASMMVGGNIKNYTRVLTTATVMETSKGEFHIAVALSILLLTLSFSVNWFLTRLQQRYQRIAKD